MSTITIKRPEAIEPAPKLDRKPFAITRPACPGCGDFASARLVLQSRPKSRDSHEQICTIAGIGCSSRFPYFVNGHGVHYIHGRAIPLASGVSLARPDLKVFVFGGDGDGFSIGGNHLEHAARKNLNLTYVIMDNFVYGLTKKQTSPTSPIGFKSKTDPWGAQDEPVNPMRKLVASETSFVARTHAAQVNHMSEMFERAIKHPGFSVGRGPLLSASSSSKDPSTQANPRKGEEFRVITGKAMGQKPGRLEGP